MAASAPTHDSECPAPSRTSGPDSPGIADLSEWGSSPGAPSDTRRERIALAFAGATESCCIAIRGLISAFLARDLP